MSKVFGMMMTCNEMGYLKYSLQSVLPHVETLLIFDVSNDGTKEYLKQFPQVIVFNEEEHPELVSLAEKRQFLLERGREMGATHYLCVDADEVMSVALERVVNKELRDLQPGHCCYVPWLHVIDENFTYAFDPFSEQAIMFCDHPSMTYINCTGGKIWNHTHEYRSPVPYGDEGFRKRHNARGGKLIHFGRDDIEYLEWKIVRSMVAEIIDGWSISEINFRYIYQENVKVTRKHYKMDMTALPAFVDPAITKVRRHPGLIQQSLLNYIKKGDIQLETLYNLDLYRNENVLHFFVVNVPGFNKTKVKWVHHDNLVYSKKHYRELQIDSFVTLIKKENWRIVFHIYDFVKYRVPLRWFK